jgi:cell division septation protein DedD
MTNHGTESLFEFLLDNRNRMIAFAVLIVICGCFFVVGFHLGKRQGIQGETLITAEPQQKPDTESTQANANKPAVSNDEGTKAAKPAASEQKLDWYKNVSRPESGSGTSSSVSESGSTPKTPDAVKPTGHSSEKPKSQASAEPVSSPSETPKSQMSAEPGTYSVQVGAFRDKKEMDVRAKMLRDKGFEYWIESPQAPGQFYFLKVGRFPSRAEAVAMRLRLEQSGFTSFVKANQ